MQEETLAKIIEAIKQVIIPDHIILFGSRAQGKADESSDYDLLVLKKNIHKKREIAQRIYLNLHHIDAPVDIIVEDSAIYEAHKENPFLIYQTISRDGIMIYG